MQVDAAVASAAAGQLGLHGVRQRVVGGVHVDPERVTALGRTHLAIQHRTGIGDGLVLAIGVEALPDTHQAGRGATLFDRLGRVFFAGVGNNEDFGIALEVAAQRLHDVRGPQAARERDMLVRRHIHSAEAQNGMFVPSGDNGVQIIVTDLRICRNITDVCAEAIFKRCDFHSFALR